MFFGMDRSSQKGKLSMNCNEKICTHVYTIVHGYKNDLGLKGIGRERELWTLALGLAAL